MTGWCPVHDRLMDGGREGRCLECGTALVEVPRAAKPARGEWVPSDTEDLETTTLEGVASTSSLTRRRTVIISAAALVLVFAIGALAGAVLSNDRTVPAAAASTRVRPIKTHSGPFPVITQDGVALRLLSVSQDGGDVHMTFDPIGGRNVKGISDLSVEVFAGATQGGVISNQPNGPNIDVQATLSNPSIAVSRVTVASVDIARSGTGPWTIRLAPSLHVTSENEPRVQRIETSRRTIDGPVTLKALVAWQDRIEIHFDTSQLQSPLGSVSVDGVAIVGHGTDGRSRVDIQPVGYSGDVFDDYTVVIDNAIVGQHAEISVSIGGLLEQLNGDWSWTIPRPTRRR